MKAIIRHFLEQPFVVFVAFAALPHSTWSIGTYMSGQAPALHGSSELPEFLFWLLPALFLSIAMDVGIVVIAGEIRRGNRSPWLMRGFYALALGSYALQFLYMLNHVPALAIGAGAAPAANWIGDKVQQLMIFALPAFLPGATILYTLAYHADIEKPVPADRPADPGMAVAVVEQSSMMVQPPLVADSIPTLEVKPRVRRTRKSLQVVSDVVENV